MDRRTATSPAARLEERERWNGTHHDRVLAGTGEFTALLQGAVRQRASVVRETSAVAVVRCL